MPRRSVRTFVIARTLVIAACLTASSLADLRAASAVMACCAKTHNQCAGVRKPDDCCKRMGHASPSGVVGTLPAAHPHVQPAIAAFSPLADLQASTRAALNPASAFKRPHDPPHLHAFSLLI